MSLAASLLFCLQQNVRYATLRGTFRNENTGRKVEPSQVALHRIVLPIISVLLGDVKCYYAR